MLQEKMMSDYVSIRNPLRIIKFKLSKRKCWNNEENVERTIFIRVSLRRLTIIIATTEYYNYRNAIHLDIYNTRICIDECL